MFVRALSALVVSGLAVATVAGLVGCTRTPQVVEITREVEVETVREVEVTKEVAVTVEVEVTREIEVLREVEVTREVEVAREVEVTREVPVTVKAEVMSEPDIFKGLSDEILEMCGKLVEKVENRRGPAIVDIVSEPEVLEPQFLYDLFIALLAAKLAVLDGVDNDFNWELAEEAALANMTAYCADAINIGTVSTGE